MNRAWLCTFVGLALAGSGGCSLILDFSDSAIPKDAAFVDADTACAFDEPNNSLLSAASVTTADTGPAAICPTSQGDDLDFYRFEVPDTATLVTVQIVYQPSANGDLDLALTDVAGAPIASETDAATTKTIACPGATCSALAAGTYVFEVSPAVLGDHNNYTFSVAIQ